jgi:hypothetical protein
VRDNFNPVPLDTFTGVELAVPRWAVENVWPDGASGIIAGRPKDGKSTLAVELALSLWSGTPMFGLPEFPVKTKSAAVLYVQQENATARVQRDFQEVMVARGLGKFVVVEHHTAEQLRAAGVKADADLVIQHFEPDPALATEGLGAFDVLSHWGVDLSKTAHVDTLLELGVSYDYLFLDPLYMLIGAVDEIKDAGKLKVILTALTTLKNETNCGVILTHHMSGKGGQNEASAMLGSTYIHAWYEAALLVRQNKSKMFEVKVDAQRSHGVHLTHTLKGQGVGRWFYDADAQGQTDADGRPSPGSTRRALNLARLAELRDEQPDWSHKQYAAELGVSTKSVQGYFKSLAERDGTELLANLEG